MTAKRMTKAKKTMKFLCKKKKGGFSKPLFLLTKTRLFSIFQRLWILAKVLFITDDSKIIQKFNFLTLLSGMKDFPDLGRFNKTMLLFEFRKKRSFDISERLHSKPAGQRKIKIERFPKKRIKSIWWLIFLFIAVLYALLFLKGYISPWCKESFPWFKSARF